MFNNTYLPVSTTGIVIKLSGGADSSILYYGVCKYLADNNLNIPLYVITMDTNRKPWYSHYAKKVIKFTNEELGISPNEHKTTFLDGNWTVEDYDWTQHCLMMSVIDDGLANIAYSGLTQNPTESDLTLTLAHPSFNKNGIGHAHEIIKATDKSRNDYSKQPIFRSCGNYTMIRPFVRKTKKAVRDWYKKYEVMETLFPLTYSCEETDNTLKIPLSVVNNFQEHTHCGCCWFCMERIYAFGRLV